VKKKLLKILILTILTAFLGGVFSLPKGKAQQMGPTPPTTFNWTDSVSWNFTDHTFRAQNEQTYEDLNDIPSISDPNVPTLTIPFTNGREISYWDFYSYNDAKTVIVKANYDPKVAGTYFDELSKHSYFLFSIGGISTVQNKGSPLSDYFLIIDKTEKRTKGIFRKKDGFNVKCHQQKPQDLSMSDTRCPWTYYQAQSDVHIWNADLLDSFPICKKDGLMMSPEYTLSRNDLLGKYAESVNGNNNQEIVKNGYVITFKGEAIGCPFPPGDSYTAKDYKDCFFPNGGGFPTKIELQNNKPPFIKVTGAGKRPTITFTLKYILTYGSDVYSYFIATTPSYSNLAIRLENCQTDNYFIETASPNLYGDDTVVGEEVRMWGEEPITHIDQTSIDNFIQKITKNGTSGCSDLGNNIDTSPTGQLAKWGVTVNQSEDQQEDEGSECVKKAQCSKLGSWYNIFSTGFYKRMMCELGCTIYEAAGEFIKKVLLWLNSVSGMSLNIFGIEKAYAAPLADQLKSPSITTAWRFSLGITDVIVIFVLLLIAFANILKLNIDIYAVKKALPGLLIGVILAHLSLLICRVIVDFSSLLSGYFLDLANNMINKTGATELKSLADKNNIGAGLSSLMGLPPEGAGVTLTGTIIGAIVLSFFGQPLIGCLLIIGVAIFFGVPGFLLMALTFLMYARLYVVWILAILSPLAFIVLGFPPAQQYFKTWWSWFLKWVFMAPIAYFFISLGAILGSITWQKGSEDSNLSFIGRWALGLIVLGMPLYVTQKIGGAIMAGWSALGQKMAGINKGGYLRKAAGFAATGAGVSMLTGKGGQPNWLGRKYGAFRDWLQSKQQQRAETFQSAISAARQPKLKQISEKMARGESLTEDDKLLLKRAKGDAVKKAEAEMMGDTPEALLSYIEPDESLGEKSRADVIRKLQKGELSTDRAINVAAALYALRAQSSRNPEARKQLEELGKEAGYDLLGAEHIYGAKPIPVVTPAQAPTAPPPTQAQLQALEAEDNVKIPIIHKNLVSRPNISERDLEGYSQHLERLYNHLNTGGTWESAPERLKLTFRDIRPDITPEIIRNPEQLKNEVERTLYTTEALRELEMPPVDRTGEVKVIEHVKIIRNQKLNIENAHSDLSSKLQNLSANISREQLPTELPTQVQNIELPQEQIINAVHAVRVRQNLTQKVTNEQILNTVRQNIKRTFETEPGQPPLTTEQIQSIIEEFRSDPNRFREIIETSAQQLEK